VAGDIKKTILTMLLEGPKTAGEIANRLKIRKSAIRTHLESLRAEQAIRSYFKTEGLSSVGNSTRFYVVMSGPELLGHLSFPCCSCFSCGSSSMNVDVFVMRGLESPYRLSLSKPYQKLVKS
jgi:hypothetical protein